MTTGPAMVFFFVFLGYTKLKEGNGFWSVGEGQIL